MRFIVISILQHLWLHLYEERGGEEDRQKNADHRKKNCLKKFSNMVSFHHICYSLFASFVVVFFLIRIHVSKNMRLHLWTQQYLENIGPSKDSSYISKSGSKNHYFFSNLNLVLSLSYKEIHIIDSFIQPLPVISISWKLLGGLWWGIYPPAKTWKFMDWSLFINNSEVGNPLSHLPVLRFLVCLRGIHLSIRFRSDCELFSAPNLSKTVAGQFQFSILNILLRHT